MKKLGFFAGSLLAVTALAGCGGQSNSIYMLQNKPEIDAALQAFAVAYTEETGVEMKVTSCGGDLCQLGTQLQADIAAGEAPDIFVIDGIPAYEQYKEMIADLSNEEWVEDTDVAFKIDGKVYGFPVAIEGWGMAYNKDLIDEFNALPAVTPIDVTELTNSDAYEAAFAALDAKKTELGIDSVVSMAASASMSWVTNDHNFNSLLSAGLEYGDLSVVEDLLEGNVDAARLGHYANWVSLLFEYADQTVLTTGTYDTQVGAFANEKAVFLHQGNWVEPNLGQANATFERAFAPHGVFPASVQETDGIFVAAPAWYVVNAEAPAARQRLAKDFLTYMATTEAGHQYMVEEAGNIPAFKSVELTPTAPLSVSVQEWAAEGKIYSWSQYYFNGDFRYNELGPIYTSFANNQITLEQFISSMKTALEGYPDFLANL